MECAIIVVGTFSVLSAATLRQTSQAPAQIPPLWSPPAVSLVALHDWSFLFCPGLLAGVASGVLLGYLMYRAVRPRHLLGIRRVSVHASIPAARNRLSSLEAGLWTLPWALAFILGSNLTPILARRISPAFLMAGGLVLAAFGFGVFTQIDATSDFTAIVSGFVIVNSANTMLP
jgi:integral membrane sensor domain MASE1